MSRERIDNPLVSVIIPTYNRAGFIAGAVESVLRQSYQPVEIIVVDDGSTDETAEKLQPYAGKIRYLSTFHGGAAHARNVGMRAASGKYLAFLDSDDTYRPYKLALQVAFMEAHPEVGMVFTEFSGAYPNGHVDEYHMRRYHRVWEAKNWRYDQVFSSFGKFGRRVIGRDVDYYIGDIFEYVLMDTVVPSNTVLFPRQLIDRIGLQDETITSGQDYDFVARICKHCTVAFLNEPTYTIFHHGAQLSNRFKDSKIRRILDEIDIAQLFLKVVTNVAYNDEEYYKRNRRMVDRRMAEIYHRLGIAWLELGDDATAKWCLKKSRLFDPTRSGYHRAACLFFTPLKARRRLLAMSRSAQQVMFILKHKTTLKKVLLKHRPTLRKALLRAGMTR